jgi:predicted MFS family arabinose efflux permease
MFVSLILALGSIAATAAVSLPVVALLAIFLLSLSLFAWHERRCREPLVDLTIFETGAFLFPVIALVLVFVAQFMMVVTGPFYLEGVMGYRPSQVGMIFLISPAVMVVAAPVAGWLYDRRRTPYYATIGMLVTAVAFFILSAMALSRNIIGILAGFGLLGLGIGFFQTPNTTAIMSALPAKKLSTASSVSATSRNLGMSLGVSFGSILLSVQLAYAGYTGSILEADPSLLAGAVSGIMVLSGVICLLVAGLTLKGGRPGEAQNVGD